MNVKFRRDVTFNEAKFSENSETGFNDKIKADFSGSIFKEMADFSLAKFHARTTFYDAHFSKASFQNTVFSDEVNFNEVIFNGRVSFTNATFESPKKIEMLNTYFHDVSGLIQILKDNKKERGVRFRSQIKELFTFRKNARRKNARTQLLSDKIKIILSANCEAVYPIESRQIKDDIYVMEFKKSHPIWYKLWWLFADCGRSFLRWAGWSLFFAFLFGLIYTPCFDFLPNWWVDLCNIIGPQFEQTSKAFSNKPPGFWSSLYFSIVTFTTLGFGDIVAANIPARIIVTFEVILGYIMLGGLISILANKLARRS